MFITTLITATLLSLSITPFASATPCCLPLPPDHHKKVIDLYTRTWNGEDALLNKTFAPTAQLYSDRTPAANGSEVHVIRSSQDILDFMHGAQTGWDKYQFEVAGWAGGDGGNIAVRWKLNGIIGEGFTIPTPLKQGDHVTYNGTDFLRVDECTGLIKQVDIAQDYVTFFHNLGLTGINV
ncbi:hypothetical protein V492_05434 [Pseudogymnoascus sp. VKM F-4246]|nr:hypothetical protein V492_05434 [Pseudogymnoascus sp. VKM F-4246]